MNWPVLWHWKNGVENYSTKQSALAIRRKELLDERRTLFNDLRQDEESMKLREEYEKKHAAVDQEEAAFRARMRRYLDIEQDLNRLKGIPRRRFLVGLECGTSIGWFQCAKPFPSRSSPVVCPVDPGSRRERQVWSGLFRDEDGNGIMEFAPPGTRLASGSWTPELNFLGWRGEQTRSSATSRLERGFV